MGTWLRKYPMCQAPYPTSWRAIAAWRGRSEPGRRAYFADELTIKMHDGKEYNGSIIGRDPSSDLAVVKVDADNLPTLEYADSDKARVGEWVLAVGNPFEYLTSTVTAGIISAKGRDLNIIQGSKTI